MRSPWRRVGAVRAAPKTERMNGGCMEVASSLRGQTAGRRSGLAIDAQFRGRKRLVCNW
jgi:hypothetical protein